MRHDILEIDASLQAHREELALRLADAEAIRLLLSSGSVVDWHKAAFADLEQVDRLLAVLLLEPSDPADEARLRYLFTEAVSYLEGFLQLRVPPKVRDAQDVREVFLWASDTRGFRRTQAMSCMILKLMHVLQHLEAADLRHQAAISEAKLLDLAHRRVVDAAFQMRTTGPPLVSFHGSKKTRLSVVTKLLSKPDDVASTIFDKLRYRVVVPTHDDLLPALRWLVHHLLPFNQAMPGKSHNNLLDPDHVADQLDPDLREQLQALTAEDAHPAPANEFSGGGYRTINVVADLPVQLSDAVLPGGTATSLGRNVYVTAEFQVVDAVTATRNEQGDNAHEAYKRRQHERVRRRLLRGRNV